MYTQCPECDTIFRVTATVLRTAQGQVRCGVCDATFDALRSLMDDIESGVNAASASRIHVETDPTPPVDRPAPTAPYLPATTVPLVPFEESGAANEWWATPVTTELPDYLRFPIADTFPTNPTGDGPSDGELAVDLAPAAGPSNTALETARAVTADRYPTHARADGADHDIPVMARDEADLPPLPLDEVDRQAHAAAPPSADRYRPLGKLVGMLLVLALAAQWVDHERGRLATVPSWQGPLTVAYGWIGRPLEPAWDLTAYDLRNWHAETQPESQTVRLRARLINRGHATQPWPLLRLTFEDRYGGTLARRDFNPSEYLPGHPANPPPFRPGTTVDADLTLSDPGSAVAGFELDTCLPRAQGIGCGTDLKGTHAE